MNFRQSQTWTEGKVLLNEYANSPRWKKIKGIIDEIGMVRDIRGDVS